jgi:hypothetical protein
MADSVLDDEGESLREGLNAGTRASDKFMPKHFARTLFFISVALLMPAANAGAAQNGYLGKECNADEIHWTITGTTSLTFDWRGAADKIRYGATIGYGHAGTGEIPKPLPFSSAGPFRQVPLTGLKANALYHYSIGTCPDHTFRTPPPAGSANFIIDAEGDIGSSRDYKDVLPDQELIAAHVPAAVLVLGDLSYANPNGQASVDQHFNDMMVWSQDVPYMPAWGNHEWDVPRNDDLRNYKGRFGLPNPQTSPGAPNSGCCGQDWSWFDYGNARFIAYPEPYTLQTWADWYMKTNRLMDEAQRDPNITFIVTFGHRAPFTSGYHHSDLDLRHYIARLAAKHKKYALNVNGHSHDYERSNPENGVVSVTAGIGGSELEELNTACLFRLCPKPSWSAFRAMHFGILQMRFTPTVIEGTYICGPGGGGKNDVSCTSGSVVDRFTIRAAEQ